MFALRRTALTAVRHHVGNPLAALRPLASPSLPNVVATQGSTSQAPVLRTMSTLVLDNPHLHASLTTSSWLSPLQEWLQQGLYWISTLKRRRKMMNKHKLRKRRKKNRMKNK